MANTWTTLLDVIYPIGSVYQAYNSTSPASRFGGTWSAIEDKFLLGIGSTYSTVTTGGESTHTLSVKEMPAHNHVFSVSGNAQAIVNHLADPHVALWDSNAGGLAAGDMQNTGGGLLTTICRLTKRFIFGDAQPSFSCVGGVA